MDIGLTLTRSWQILWRNKFMWALGLLPGITHMIGALLQHWLTDYVKQDIVPIFSGATPEELLFTDELPFVQELAAEFFRGEFLIIGSIWLFLALVVFWLVFTLTEASIIAATLHIDQGKPITLKQSLSIGWKFVGKFIAIDALVFFPWFVVALSAMILAMIVLLGVVGMTTQNATMESMMGVMTIGFGCVSLLGCLLLPLGFLTMQFRTLAFRDTAVFGNSIRGSVKHTWQVVKSNIGSVIILIAVMWGIDYIFGFVLSLITIPLGTVTAVSIFNDSSSIGSSFTNFLSLLIKLLLAIPKAMLFVYIGIAWTLAYLDLTKDDESNKETSGQ